jgi:hypothetical protein
VLCWSALLRTQPLSVGFSKSATFVRTTASAWLQEH